MGQAKQKRDALRKEMLEVSRQWNFPPSPWEASICEELRERKADVLVVHRASETQLKSAGMVSNACHANVRWYVENDPTGLSRAVTGWCVQWPNFVLHSVVETGGTLMCITPTPLREKEIYFLPDPKISWVKNGETFSAIRDGQTLGLGVRVYPEFTMAQGEIVCARILSGVDLYKAIEFTDDEMNELKRRFIPSGDSR